VSSKDIGLKFSTNRWTSGVSYDITYQVRYDSGDSNVYQLGAVVGTTRIGSQQPLYIVTAGKNYMQQFAPVS
jgi:hypothetical protein